MKKINFRSRFSIDASGLGRIPAISMIPAYSGGKLLLRDFEYPVVIDLSTCSSENNIPILLDHFGDRRLGHTERVTINDHSIDIEGLLSFDNEDVREIVQTSKTGMKWQASVGTGVVEPKNQRILSEGETIQINGQKLVGPIIIVSNIEIREVSIVPVGADSRTDVTIQASQLKGSEVMTFEEWAADKGFDLEAMDEANTEALRQIYEKEIEEDSNESDLLADEKEKEEVKASGSTKHRRVPRRDPRTYGLAGNPASRAGVYGEPTKAIEASMLMAGGLSGQDIEKLGYDQQSINIADSAGGRGIGIQELFHRVIRAAGMHYPGGRKDNQFIRTAFEASHALERRAIRAGGSYGFSTINIPGILSNVANKTLLNAYNRVESAAMYISRIASATDFKEMSHYQFEMDGTLKVVPPGGEIENISLGETAFKNRIETRGAILTLTRQDIINDDLEAFLRIPNEFGRKAAQTLEHVAFQTLFDNIGDLFNEGNANMISSPYGLNIASLTDATRVFGEQRDNSGTFILVQPRILLVPPSLGVIAKAIYTSTSVNETTGVGDPKPIDNPFAGQYRPVVSPFMGETAGLGGKDDDYLLLADPLDVAVLEIAFLGGNRVPVIESQETAFNTLGMSWRCYFDFGVAPQDPKGGVYVTKSPSP